MFSISTMSGKELTLCHTTPKFQRARGRERFFENTILLTRIFSPQNFHPQALNNSSQIQTYRLRLLSVWTNLSSYERGMDMRNCNTWNTRQF